MDTLLSNIIATAIINLAAIYAWATIYKEKIKSKDCKLYVGFLFITVFVYFNYYVVNAPISSIVTMVALCFTNWLIYRKSLKEVIISTILYEIMMILCETIIMVVLILLSSSTDLITIVTANFGGMIGTILTAIAVFGVAQLKMVRKLYLKTLNLCDKLPKISVILTATIVIIIYSVFFFTAYESLIKENFVLLLIMSTVMSVIYGIVIFLLMKTKNDYTNTFNKYTSTLDSLKEYEKIMDKYKVDIHENKNEWLTVRNMVAKGDKNAVKYIDKIVDNKIKDNEKINYETSAIPEGGLRAIIYSKMLYMDNKKIKYSLDIERSVRKIDLIEIGEDNTLQICKIIGVYLDNAIEEVSGKKECMINISMYTLENEFNITIANNYTKKLDIDKINDIGYSTKGKNHGYGLSLVKQIIAKNNRFSRETKIIDNVFSQTLKIKM